MDAAASDLADRSLLLPKNRFAVSELRIPVSHRKIQNFFNIRREQ